MTPIGCTRFSLEGQRILVTGAGRGLGRAMALGLAEAGARVAVVSRTRADLDELAATLGDACVPIDADLADMGKLDSLVDRAEEGLGGGLQVVVHAAGTQHRQPAEVFDPVEWDTLLRLNLTVPFRLSQEIGRRQLERREAGSHIFIGSLASRLALPNVVAYTASKSAVFGVIRSLSSEWSGRGIRVNGIGPGYFRTRLTEPVFDDPRRAEEMLGRIPMGRFGDAQELIGPAVFLASDASSYVTGQLLMVDGGWSSS